MMHMYFSFSDTRSDLKHLIILINILSHKSCPNTLCVEENLIQIRQVLKAVGSLSSI
jgi:hypothetical protein